MVYIKYNSSTYSTHVNSSTYIIHAIYVHVYILAYLTFPHTSPVRELNIMTPHRSECH